MKTITTAVLCILMSFLCQSQTNYTCKNAIDITDSSEVKSSINFVEISNITILDYYNFDVYANWYKIEGNDQFVTVNIEGQVNLYTFIGSCSGKVVETGNYFFSKKGVTYYLCLYKYIEVFKDIPFKLSIKKGKKEIDCSLIPEVKCGEKLELKNYDLFSCENYNGPHYTYWLKIIGTGKKIILTPKLPQLYYTVKLSNNDCTNFECRDGVITFENDGPIIFDTEVDEEYYIAIIASYSLDVKLEFDVSCEELTENSVCRNAIKLACDSTEILSQNKPSISLQKNPLDEQDYYLYLNTSWFYIESEKDTVILSGNNIFDFTTFYSTNDNCKELIKLEQNKILTEYGEAQVLKKSYDKLYVRVRYNGSVSQSNVSLSCNAREIIQSDCIESAQIPVSDKKYYIESKQESICNLGSGNWYKLTGNKIHEFDITLTDRSKLDVKAYISLSDNSYSAIYAQVNSASKIAFISSNKNPVFVNFNTMQLRDSILYKIREIDYCEMANKISCDTIFNEKNTIQYYEVLKGNSFYTELKGNDQRINITFNKEDYHFVSLYRYSCDTLMPITSSNNIQNLNIFLEKDSTYILKTSNYSSSVLNQIKCDKGTDYSTPLSAPIVACGSTISLDQNNATYLSKYSNLNSKSAFIKILGDGTIIQLEDLNKSMTYEIYELNGTEAKLIQSNKKIIKFQSLADKTYLCVISFSANSLSKSEVKISCLEPYSNANCASAELASCNNIYTFDLNGVSNILSKDNELGSLWWKYQGDGKVIKLKSNIGSQTIEIYEGNCNDQTLVYKSSIGEPIEFLMEDNLTYQLKVIYHSKQNSFMFECEEMIELKSDKCNDAYKINCNETYEYTTKMAAGGAIKLEKDTSLYRPNINWLKLDTKETYIELKNPLNAVKIEVLKGNCETGFVKLDKNKFNRNSFIAEPMQQYYLVLSNSFENNEKYPITVKCSNIADQCENKVNLQCGFPMAVNTLIADSTVFGKCALPKKGNWYVHNGNDYITIKFDKLFATTSEPQINVFAGHGTCDSLNCYKSFTITNLKDSIILFPNDSNKDLNIFINSNDGFIGNVTFACSEKQTNISCESAQAVKCGNTVYTKSTYLDYSTEFCGAKALGQYFSYLGTGSFLRIKGISNSSNITKVQVLKGDCNGGECLNSSDFYNEGTIVPALNKDFVFRTEENVLYYIKIINKFNEALGLAFECVDVNKNIDCSSSIELGCDSKSTATLLGGGLTPELNCIDNTLGFSSFNWYKLDRQDKKIQFKIDSMNSSQVVVNLVKGNCGFIQCVKSAFLSENQNFVFDIKAETDYYLIVYTFNKFIYDKIYFSVNCIMPAINDECTSPIELECGSLIEGNLALASPSTSTNCADLNNDLWYSIKGDDQKIIVKPSLGNEWTGSIFISEYNGDCFTLGCFAEIQINNPNDQYEFFAEKNKTYYIQYYAGEEQVSFQYKVDCVSENNESPFTGNKIMIFPNPANKIATLSINSNLESKGQINIYNQIGQLVYHQLAQIKIGKNNYSLPIQNLSDGYYIVKLKSEQQTYTSSIILNKE
jgi:hypothetical protein